MKSQFYFLVTFLVFNFSFFAQTDDSFAGLRTQLQSWDPVRGEWLANSFRSISKGEAIPDRTFPEELTPYELLTMVPMDRRRELLTTVQTNNRNPSNNTSNNWAPIEMILNHSLCERLTGRSYGDPHLNSFDKATYSFQTVGEFVLSKSNKGHFEVQTRQKPQSESFSLNTAVAMNVGGDRLCYYAEDKPDFNNTTFRLEGQPIQLQGRTYFLPHGGTIRLEGRNYIISWPTGETVILDSRMSGSMQLANVTVQIFACDRAEFEGLLGNANGDMNDDFNSRNNNNSFRPAYASFSTFGNPTLSRGSEIAEKEYLAFLAKDFAEEWRVNDLTTLFDYGMGRSTLSYTDRSFPRVHYTLNDLDMGRQTNARRRCEQMGITPEEMRGCIFDNGFLDITPNPIPTPTNPARGRILHDIKKPALNTNNRTFGEGGLLSSAPRESNPDGTIKDFNPQIKEPIRGNDFEPVNKVDGGKENNLNNTDNSVQDKKPETNKDFEREKPSSSSPVKIEKPVINSKPIFSSPANKPSTSPSKPTSTPSKPAVSPAKPSIGGNKPGKG
jgi:hypothetical protein